MSRSDKPTKVLVSFPVFRQEDEMEQPTLVGRGFIKPTSGGKVDFTPNDWLDPGLVSLFIEFDRAVHGTVIGDGNRHHLVGSNPFKKGINADCPVKEAILGVDMEVDETG
jgi:hypothetical protein